MLNDPANVYERFIEESEAVLIKADDSAVHVVGMLTRAAKRAQMVVDGDLLPVAERPDVTPERYR